MPARSRTPSRRRGSYSVEIGGNRSPGGGAPSRGYGTVTPWRTNGLIATSWSLAPEQEVDHSTGTRNSVEIEAIEELVRRLPEAFTATELEWRYGDVHRVDEVGIEELADRRN